MLLYAIIRCNLYENIFCFIVFFPYIAGYIFNTVGISGVGGAMKYSGLAILFVTVMMGKAKLTNVLQGLWPLFVLLFLFILSVNTTTGGDYAGPKLSATIRHGFVLFFAFAFLFSNLEKFNFTKLGVLFIVLSTVLLPLSIVTNGISGPSDLFDFAFLRHQTEEDLFSEYNFHIGYQVSGFLMVQGLGFFLTASKKNHIPLIIVVLILGAMLLALLYGGSRQAILSFLIIVFLWVLLANHNTPSLHINEKKLSKRVFRVFKWLLFLLITLVVFYYVLNILTEEEGLLNSVAEEGFVEGGGRGEWLMSGIRQFLEHPIWGVGYGRFMVYNYYGSYPHNLFIELLCETGLIGFTIGVILLFITSVRSRKMLLPIMFLWLAYFLRAMVSEDISMNITVFVILFALSSANNDIKAFKDDESIV